MKTCFQMIRDFWQSTPGLEPDYMFLCMWVTGCTFGIIVMIFLTIGFLIFQTT